MKKVIVVLFCLTVFYSQAQNISGRVVDEDGDVLPSATVMLLQQSDSMLVSFTMAGTDGNFELKKVPEGNFVVRINYVGFDPIDKLVAIDKKDVAVGDMVMKIAVLEEVVVEGEVAPVTLLEDTIQYNAAAFETRTNAVVEDLLRKLPGVEVDRDGNITAEGETVTQVLVDGKEFFGNDPKMATKNLPAESIDKIQVFDQKSRFAQFTSVDDGNETKTINLELKETHRRGSFGYGRAGYGTDKRFDLAGNVNQFRNDNQFSFIGSYNNINNAGGDQGGNNSNSSGFITTANGGLNYNREFKKLKIRSNYNVTNTDNEFISESETRDLIGGFDTDQESVNNSIGNNHSINLNAEYKFDDTQDIEIRNEFTLGANTSESTTSTENLQNGSVTSANSGFNETNSDYHSINSAINYRKKLGKNGRSLVGEITFSDQNSGSNIYLNNFTQSITLGDSTTVQDQLSTNHTTTYGGEFSYTEPISENQYLEFRYIRSFTEGGNDTDFFDIDEEGRNFNDTLSTFYERNYDYSRVGLTYNYQKEAFSFNVGTNYQFSVLEGLLPELEQSFQNEFNRFLPFARMRYRIGNGMTSINLNYRTGLQEPSIEQLQPITDNSNPQNVSAGNPDLNAAYLHTAGLNFRVFDQFTQMTFFSSANLTYTQDNIVTSRTINYEDFSQYTIPVNAGNAYSLRANASFSSPFKPFFFKRKVRFNLNYNWSSGESFTIVNDIIYETRNINHTSALGLENIKKNVLDWGVGLIYNIGKTDGDQMEASQDFANTTYFVDLALFLGDKWTLSSKFDYQNYGSASFTGDLAVKLWQASLERNLLKNDRGQLKLTAFDLLDENRGINRTATVNQISETRTSSIGRYFMLSFTYRLSNYAGNMGGNFRGRR